MKKKTTEDFVKEVFELVGNEYKVLGNYVGALTKIEMLHEKCGRRYAVKPTNFLSGKRCPKCFGNEKKTTEVFKMEVFEQVGNEYKVLGNYVTNKTKIAMLHNCGHSYMALPKHFLNGVRCPKCFGNEKKTTEAFKMEVFELVGNAYTVIGNYMGAHTKIELLHGCGHSYMVEPHDFLRGKRCPKCSISKMEKQAHEWFLAKDIPFQGQFKFDDCRDKNPLPFDFAIFSQSGELLALLECQGGQHFQPVDYAGKGMEWAIANFKATQEHDRIKRGYCREKGIRLIAIGHKTKFKELLIDACSCYCSGKDELIQIAG